MLLTENLLQPMNDERRSSRTPILCTRILDHVPLAFRKVSNHSVEEVLSSQVVFKF